MPRVRSIATALPSHRLDQEDALRACRAALGDDRLLAVFRSSGVDTRYFAFPPEYYLNGHTFAERNRDYVSQALALGERAIEDALRAGGLKPADVDHLFFVTTTGLATPSVDALLSQRLGFKRGLGRHPLFGLGCAGGAGALGRAAALLEARPRERALVVSIELCGQTFRSQDRSAVNYVGAALFGDGAAAVVLEGDEHAATPGPRIAGWTSEIFPGTQGVMGWEFEDDGLKLVLTKEVPRTVARYAPAAIDAFLAGHGLSRADVRHFVLHPGGRRVLETYKSALGVTPAQLGPAETCLRTVGNLSSAAVLFVLAETRGQAGDVGLVAAVGPGFAIELVLLRW